MITLDDISIHLPANDPQATPVLTDIHLDIDEGEWVALVGPNGAGKSTLLHAIAGLLPPRRGAIRYTGGEPPRIAILLQEPDNQFVASTVENDLFLSLPPTLTDPERVHRVREAVGRFGLDGLLARNPHRLSGGEKQRLAFAIVWLAEPAVLLLDEPTAYLDSQERSRCTEFVRELNARGVTIVWATLGGPDLAAAKRVVYLEGGSIRFDGEPVEFSKAVERDDYDVVSMEMSPTTRANTDAPPTGAPIIRLSDVAFAYDATEVLRDVTLEVHEGAVVGVTGRNGSGKSTLLSIMSGVLEPTRGRVVRRYKRVVDRGRQNVFCLFQSPERLFFAETVLEEIAFGLKALGVTSNDRLRIVAASLERVGLSPEAFMDREPLSLSFGEMRRVALAMLLALSPRFALLDEPASCLDTSGRAVLTALIKELRAGGAAVAVASHDVISLAGVADHRIALEPITR